VDWSRPDAADQANALARLEALHIVQAYRGGGNDTLGEYRDREHHARVADQFETMIGRASALPDVLPELRRYLLEYPKAELGGVDSFFYWEKVAFGLKPTIRSQQDGLTGVKGSIVRKVVVDKTRSSLERALASIKRSVEQSAPRR
jgi:hypothetical protein